MDREAIMEMLKEYGVNSESDLSKAMKHLSPINIGVFVTPVDDNTLSMNEPHRQSIIIRKEDQIGQSQERACV